MTGLIAYYNRIGGRLLAPVALLSVYALPVLAADDLAQPAAAVDGVVTDDVAVPIVIDGADHVVDHAVSHGAEHAASGGLPQFNAEWFPSQLFWLGVTFAVLYVFCSRVPLPRIEQTMRNRQHKIQDDMTAAEDLSKRAAEIREFYERDMAKAREKASDALKQMDDRVKQKMHDRLYSYRTKFTAEIARAEDELARERDRLTSELDGIAAETAAHATSLILNTPADLDHAQQVVGHLHRNKAA